MEFPKQKIKANHSNSVLKPNHRILEAMHEGAIMVSVHSLTQDSHNVLSRSRIIFVQVSGRI